MQPSDKTRLKKEYQRRLAELSAILFRLDPIGLNMEENTDEYDLEAGTILPRLRECQSPDDVARVIREEFTRWFSSETAVRMDAEGLAGEVWSWWDGGARSSLYPDAA